MLKGFRGEVRPRSTLEFLFSRSYCDSSHALTDRYLDDRLAMARGSLFKRDLVGHFGCVNAIEFSNMGGRWIASGVTMNIITIM